jgi:hypothetical protein
MLGNPAGTGTFRPSRIEISNFWPGRIRIQCCGSGIFIPDPDFNPSRIRTRRPKVGGTVRYEFDS